MKLFSVKKEDIDSYVTGIMRNKLSVEGVEVTTYFEEDGKRGMFVIDGCGTEVIIAMPT